MTIFLVLSYLISPFILGIFFIKECHTPDTVAYFFIGLLYVFSPVVVALAGIAIPAMCIGFCIQVLGDFIVKHLNL